MIAFLLFLLSSCPANQEPQAAPPLPKSASAQEKRDALAVAYDVHDLLPPPPQREPGKSSAGTTRMFVGTADGEQHEVINPPQAPADARADEHWQLEATRSMCERIRPLVTPPLHGEESLQAPSAGILVMYAATPKLAWLGTFLDRHRARSQFVEVETRWIEGPKGAFERMGIPAGGSASVLAAAERSRFEALAKDDSRFQLVSAPRLVVQPLTATATSWVGEELAYIKGYTLETVQPGDVKIADPEIAHVDEGLELRANAVLLEDQRIGLDLRVSSTAVRRPIATRSVRLALDIATEVTIAMPEVDTKSISACFTLAPEGLVAFSARLAGKEDREILVLVSARPVTAAYLQAPR